MFTCLSPRDVHSTIRYPVSVLITDNYHSHLNLTAIYFKTCSKFGKTEYFPQYSQKISERPNKNEDNQENSTINNNSVSVKIGSILKQLSLESYAFTPHPKNPRIRHCWCLVVFCCNLVFNPYSCGLSHRHWGNRKIVTLPVNNPQEYGYGFTRIHDNIITAKHGNAKPRTYQDYLVHPMSYDHIGKHCGPPHPSPAH